MSTFWNLWAVLLTLIFFVLMVSVVVKYWRSNHKADHDHTIGTFDGIEEKDAPPPKLLFVSYAVAFLLSAGYLVLYPGLGEWEGLVDWEQSDDKLSSPSTTLNEQFAQTSETTLEGWLLFLRSLTAVKSFSKLTVQRVTETMHKARSTSLILSTKTGYTAAVMKL